MAVCFNIRYFYYYHCNYSDINAKKNPHNKLSSGINSAIGSLVYTIFSLIIFGISYLIFGAKIVDEIWFIIIGTLSFLLTKFFLRKIGFWRY